MSLHITIVTEYSGKTTTLIKEYSHNKSLNKIIIIMIEQQEMIMIISLNHGYRVSRRVDCT